MARAREAIPGEGAPPVPGSFARQRLFLHACFLPDHFSVCLMYEHSSRWVGRWVGGGGGGGEGVRAQSSLDWVGKAVVFLGSTRRALELGLGTLLLRSTRSS